MIKISDPYIGEEEINAVRRVLTSGTLARGQETKSFEKHFAAYVGTKDAVATSSGTTALHTALIANGIGKGDEVITSGFSFIASANTILHTGAKPVFADVNYDDFNIDTEDVERKITDKTKAIVVVHLYGQSCDMKRIREICETHNLKLIEDACQAHGAEYEGKRVGSFGTGCFSFYATKNMVTGEGGIITTDDDKVAESARMIISHGSKINYENVQMGYNFRMTEMQAAIGNVQIKRVDELNQKRIENAGLFSSLIKNHDISVPKVMNGRKHVFHLYTIKTQNREEIIEKLQKNNIGYGIYYPKPIHKQELYQKLGYKDSLPVSEKLSGEVLSLPVHPKVTKENIEKIISCIE